MRCTTCDYPLWGITGRTCPECGSAFRPSDFRLVPNAVRFLCPHCHQQYFGTTALGHLDPIEFDCTMCGAHIHMDEMTLEPREGITDDRTRAERNPWLERPRLKTFTAYWRTVGKSLGSPIRLARATPPTSSTWSSIRFFATNAAWVIALSALPIAGIMLVSLAGGHRGSGGALVPIAVLIVIPTLGLAAALVVWGFLTQILLVFLGGKPTHFGTTYKALAYASAPVLLMAIPCIGMYATPISMVWWGIGAIAMLATMHRIAWWRAAIAHVIAGLITLGIPTGLIGYGIYRGISAMNSLQPSSQAAASSLHSTLMLRAHQPGATGTAPLPAPTTAHILDIVSATPWQVPDLDDLASGTVTSGSVLLDGFTLESHLARSSSERGPIDTDLRAAALPSGIHRLGNVVFTYAGVNIGQPQRPDLWLAIVWPDPDDPAASFTAPATVSVMLAFGTLQDIPLAQFPRDLAAQNANRKALGLPEIPDPATVHMWPAGSKYAPTAAPAVP